MDENKRMIPILSLEDLSDTVTKCADRAIEIAARFSSSSNYYIGYDYLSDLITEDDYKLYFDFIVNEVANREEVLDLQWEGRELNMIIGTDWCKSYIPLPDEPEEGYGFRDVTPGISMAEKARRYDIDQTLKDRIAEVRRAKKNGTFQRAEHLRENVPGVPGMVIHSNRFGQPLLGLEFDQPWQYALQEKICGDQRWRTPPKGFVPLLGELNDLPTIIYTKGFTLDEEPLFNGDFQFMNAVVGMTASALERKGDISPGATFYGVFANKELGSADILVCLPATLSAGEFENVVFNLNEAMKSPEMPVNNLARSLEFYNAAKSRFVAVLNTFNKSASPPLDQAQKEWLSRSVPNLAAQFCRDFYRNNDFESHNIASLILSNPNYAPLIGFANAITSELNRLSEPLTLTTYASPSDPNYDLSSSETPAVTFEIPYGALREILANDAREGEEPLSVEDFLISYTYDYSESIRDAYEAMKRKPSLEEQLKNAKGQTNHDSQSLGRSTNIPEKEK